MKPSFAHLGFAALIVFSAILYSSCGPNTNQIRRMQMIEEGVDSPTTIEELKDAISKFQNRVEDIVNADIRIGIWYKILGTRYLDNKMYGKALEAFRSATEYYPNNQNLYYFIGLCSGYMAKSSLDYELAGTNFERRRFYDLAESAYLRAIELEPRYVRALYGLSVLYIFELNRTEEAIPHLELVNEIESRNGDAQMLLARSYYTVGQFDKAVAMYDRVISTTKDDTRKKDAIANRAFVLENRDAGF
jgi:tetratricopeptide (TPR) repeat protein